MSNVTPHAQRVIEWRENLSVLDEAKFFELIKMYLGNVKTPFNKQKLIEELGSFLRKTENQKLIFSLLDNDELQILAAVKFIVRPSVEKVISFFCEHYSYPFLFDKIVNLEERLLIYNFTDKNTKEQFLKLNPMFDGMFDKILKESILLQSPVLAEKSMDVPEEVSPELLAAFVSFIFDNKDLLKSDRTFKKRIHDEIEERFPGREALLLRILNGFLNLSIAVEGDDGIEIDREKLSSFAELPLLTQRLYLCMASCRRFSRMELPYHSERLFKIATAIPAGGWSKKIFVRSAMLLLDEDSFASHGRFSAMLRGSYSKEESPVVFDEALVDAAFSFGILKLLGKDADGGNIYVGGDILRFSERKLSSAERKGILTVDSSLCVRIMPGLSLADLLSLVDFLELKFFDTAATFEITKKSILRGFDTGLTTEKICSTIESFSNYALPQNLLVSVEDWQKSYSAATVFNGYVLKVDPEKAVLIENNPKFRSFIEEILAPGIYLLSLSDDERALSLVSKCGFDFLGKVRTPTKKVQKLGFPSLYLDSAERSENGSPGSEEKIDFELSSQKSIEDHLSAMRAELAKLRFPDDQKEGLELRISRKIVLLPSQLKGETVRFERTEAGGIDFSGKIHVIDSAIASSAMLYLEFSNPDASKKEPPSVFGKPVALEKENGFSYVRILAEPEKVERVFEVGRISFVKKIRGSIF